MEQELKFVVKNNLSLQMHFSAKVLFDFIHGAIFLVVTNNFNI